ncbi:hypothetical protein Poli38472_010834 [Pythium oligandrum]|uniref:Actin-related protein 6 n=1 Tax=Pythium oligandrum TaxID=41045 RepID=A0A8K1FGL1_PYTOL|nr:hypothetical protein Poli38472_010834 [Pythium oligandrum]|eukprot:TMW61771.1 hypothetical protein Poli38472_010834 [Pythium oligandrum]
MVAEQVLVLDVGGATLKAARVSRREGKKHAAHYAMDSSSVSLLANQIATTTSGGTILGADLREKERQRARMHYMRPIERGYCVNWNVETELWTHLFSKKMLNMQPRDHALVATAPLFAPTVVNETMDQVVFEEFGFQAYARVPAAEMCVLSYAEYSAQAASTPAPKRRRADPASSSSTEEEEEVAVSAFHESSCQLVIDSGFSFTHVVPLVNGRVYQPGVKRINVGGKLLTNYLKEIVSYRQWNVMDETMVINELKESLCYCSMEFENELKRYHTDRQSRKHWILPDFVRTFEGHLRTEDELVNGPNDDDQALEMGVEMITVPEVLFHPSDIGIDQAGLAEVVMQSVRQCPEELHATLLENILLVGGNTKFRNFRERLERDLRPLVPVDYQIQIHTPDDPILATWRGSSIFAQSEDLTTRSVTKQEYDEHGSNICLKRFR